MKSSVQAIFADLPYNLSENRLRSKNSKTGHIRTMPLVQVKERLREENGKKALHPTQKPEEMLKRIILGFSNEGDVVLDPFSGSGTTPFSAKKYNRKFIAIEKEKKYFEAIKQRLDF